RARAHRRDRGRRRTRRGDPRGLARAPRRRRAPGPGDRHQLVARNLVHRPADPDAARRDDLGRGTGAGVLARPAPRRRLPRAVASGLHVGGALGGRRAARARDLRARAARHQGSDVKEQRMDGWILPTIAYVFVLGSTGVTAKLALRTISWEQLVL